MGKQMLKNYTFLKITVKYIVKYLISKYLHLKKMSNENKHFLELVIECGRRIFEMYKPEEFHEKKYIIHTFDFPSLLPFNLGYQERVDYDLQHINSILTLY